MPSFASTTLRLFRRVLGAPSRTEGHYAGNPTVLDGNSAVAVTEAAVGEAAGLGASYPADTADLAWRAEQSRHGVNLAGAPLASQSAEGPCGALANAIGLALAGIRATSFLSAPDLAAASHLLATAAGHRLPIVIHVTGRALCGQAPALGSGHEAFHLSADSGCFLLTAANVQEAVDFTLIVRRTAEQSLLPGLVAMDAEQTALSMQDVRLAPGGLIEKLLGRPDDQIAAQTPAQQLLFGDTRRRLPRWHNPDRPVLLGALQPPEAWGAGKTAARAFFDAHLTESLDEAFTRFAEQTGRRHRRVSAHRVDDARLILVAQGAAVETAEAAADQLRDKHRVEAGVLGIRCLRPFPGAEIAGLLSGGARVCVLERMDTPLAEDPPLLRELRAAVDRALENGAFGAATHPSYPALGERQRPRFLSVVWGLGGLPLRGADLIALGRDAENIRQAQVYLGMRFSHGSSAYPKRQVLLERIRRSYPEIGDLGLYGIGPTPDLRPKDALTLAIYRLSGGLGEGLAPEAAVFLQRLTGGGLRSRPALFTESWGSQCTERVTTAPDPLRDPGDETPVDLALLTIDPGLPGLEPQAGLGNDGALLVQTRLPDEGLWARLPGAARRLLKQGSARLYRIGPPEASISVPNEYLLGAVCAVLLELGMIDSTQRRLLGAREDLLSRSVAGHKQRLASFEAGLDAPHRIETNALALSVPTASAGPDDEAPSLVRRFGNIDDAYDSLPRFWDQIGVLYHNGELRELAPDPYLAVGAIPPLSAGFRDLSPLRSKLPAFDPALCTGCGNCWSGCPDSAVGAVALSPARLIEVGINQTGGDSLRPLASKLAAAMADLCRNPDSPPPPSAGELLDEAYGGLKAKLPFPDDRKAAIEKDVKRLTARLGCLPLAVTAPFFLEPEGAAKGSGELLALTLNPESCKGCGICIAVCEPGALEAVRQSSQSLTHVRNVQEAWDGLPDTDMATVRRAADHPEVGPLAASLLARNPALAMTGGDGAEPGSGAKLAMRLALATVESRQVPLFKEFTQQVDETRERITSLIRDILSDALPSDDLDALSRGLDGVASRQADLSVFLGEAEDAIESAVDAPRLRRLVDLARRLGDLGWRLREGRQGLGRARLGLVLSPGAAVGWASAFPHNPFAEPVVVDATGDGARLAAGLLEGQLRQATEGFALLRKARLELEHPEDAARRWSELDALNWRDLTAEEQALCPSLLLVGDSGLLGGQGLSQVSGLLGGDLPVKMLLLADLDLGLTSRATVDAPLSQVEDSTVNLGLLALAQRGACIAQTSLGMPDHLCACLESAFGFAGPALLHVHAPSPRHHGFASDRTLERAQSAVKARVFPLFRYAPQAEGVFGSRFSLEGNPSPREPWDSMAVAHPLASDPAADAGPFTSAHWFLGERRFAGFFSPLDEDASEALPLAEYLELAEKARRNKTPFIEKADNGYAAKRLRVDARLVRATEERLHAWRLLQELAGLVTPFTARVQQEAEERVAAERAAELSAQAREYEERISRVRAEFQEELRRDMRERLMALSGYARPAAESQPETEGEA